MTGNVAAASPHWLIHEWTVDEDGKLIERGRLKSKLDELNEL